MGEWKETSIGRLPNDWEVGLFEADLKIQGRIGWKGYKQTDLVEEGPFVIGGTEINSSIHLDLSSAPHLSREKYEESPEIMLGDKDVLLVTRGNLGQVGLYRKEYGEATINPSVIILKDFVGHPEFLFYYLISRPGNYNVMSLASGSSVPAIYQSEVKTLEYPKPPLAEQRAIASVLSSLDAKIDLLHRQNKTLEAMAEALFRQWFVEEAEEGWEEIRINDLVEIQSGFPFKSDTFNDSGPYQVITIKAVQDGYLELGNASRVTMLPERMKAYCHLQVGDILLSLTGNVGRCCMVDSKGLLLNQRVAKLHPRNNENRSFVYFLFRQAKFRELLEETAKGTAQANLSPIETGRITTLLPPEHLLQQFNTIATPMLDRILMNKLSIRRTHQLRDTLLPKLMSGEVRVEARSTSLEK